MIKRKSPRDTSAKVEGMKIRSLVRAGKEAYVIRVDRETITR